MYCDSLETLPASWLTVTARRITATTAIFAILLAFWRGFVSGFLVWDEALCGPLKRLFSVVTDLLRIPSPGPVLLGQASLLCLSPVFRDRDKSTLLLYCYYF